MTYMSETEWRILINQFRILSMLDREQIQAYERSINMLAKSTSEAEALASVRQIEIAEVDAPMSFTFRILSFYSFLQNSFYALELKEKIQIDHTALVFPGFHETSENEYNDYVSFIRDSLGQFSLLETIALDTPHAPMIPFYKSLLAIRPSCYDTPLDFDGVTDIIGKIEALLMPAPEDATRLETATAA